METHITKLFHVHLNRIVGYRICSLLGTEKVLRHSDAAIASSAEKIAVLRKHARLLRGSLFAWLDLMSCVLCESYYFAVDICVVLAPFVLLSFHKKGEKVGFRGHDVHLCAREWARKMTDRTHLSVNPKIIAIKRKFRLHTSVY